MSTILKALRRLEQEEGSTSHKAESKTGLDPKSLSTSALRDGILVEEMAAEAVASSEYTKRPALVAAYAVAGLIGLAAIVYGIARLGSDEAPKGVDRLAQSNSRTLPTETTAAPPGVPLAAAPPRPATAPLAPSPVSPAPPLPAAPLLPPPAPAARGPVDEPVPLVAVARDPSPQVERGIVRPTRAAAKPIAEETRPAPVVERPMRSAASLAAATAVAPARKQPKAAPIRPKAVAAPVKAQPEARQASRPRDVARSSPPAPVSAGSDRNSTRSSDWRQDSVADSPASRVDLSGLADVSVERTSWHPKPERRSARVRVRETGEVLSLGEGDYVGGMIVEEITPSSVLFEAGGVEIRRRIGSGG